MLQLEKFEDLSKYVFYLNQNAMDEIISYSNELRDNIPEFLKDLDSASILFAEGGTDEDGKDFPDTFIGIQNVPNPEFSFKIAGIYASDFQYKAPSFGEEIYLKKTAKIKNK